MKIYISGTFERRPFLRPYRDKIWALGHHVISSWLDEVAKPEHMLMKEFRRKLAIKDTCEVYAADLLIIDSAEKSGGKNCEYGISVARFHNSLQWVVGKPSMFHELSDRFFGTWDEAIECLKKEYHVTYNPNVDANGA